MLATGANASHRVLWFPSDWADVFDHLLGTELHLQLGTTDGAAVLGTGHAGSELHTANHWLDLSTDRLRCLHAANLAATDGTTPELARIREWICDHDSKQLRIGWLPVLCPVADGAFSVRIRWVQPQWLDHFRCRRRNDWPVAVAVRCAMRDVMDTSPALHDQCWTDNARMELAVE